MIDYKHLALYKVISSFTSRFEFTNETEFLRILIEESETRGHDASHEVQILSGKVAQRAPEKFRSQSRSKGRHGHPNEHPSNHHQVHSRYPTHLVGGHTLIEGNTKPISPPQPCQTRPFLITTLVIIVSFFGLILDTLCLITIQIL